MKWIRGKGEQQKSEVPSRENFDEDLRSHLSDLRSFLREDYKPVIEGFKEVLELARWIGHTSALEDDIKKAQKELSAVSPTLNDLTKGIRETSTIIRKEEKQGRLDRQALENNKTRINEVAAAVKQVEEAAGKLDDAGAKAAIAVQEAKAALDEVEVWVKDWYPLEQKLDKLAERGMSLVSETAINSVAARFKESAKQQTKK